MTHCQNHIEVLFYFFKITNSANLSLILHSSQFGGSTSFFLMQTFQSWHQMSTFEVISKGSIQWYDLISFWPNENVTPGWFHVLLFFFGFFTLKVKVKFFFSNKNNFSVIFDSCFFFVFLGNLQFCLNWKSEI